MTVATKSEWLGATGFARLIRKALKAEFPGVKFSVRSNSYSGGSTIDVRYKAVTGYRRDEYGRTVIEYAPGMPTKQEVDAVVGRFQTKGFDGMINLSYYIDLALDKDDNVVGTRSSGTEGSRGSVPAWDTTDTYASATKVVRYVHGSSYVFVEALPLD